MRYQPSECTSDIRLTIVRPAIFFLSRDIFVGLMGPSCIGTNPRSMSRCFSTGVRKLYSDYSALGVCEVYDPLEGFYVAVGPNPLDDDKINRSSLQFVS